MSKNYVLVVGASSAIGCEIIRQIAEEDTVILAHYRSGKDPLGALQTEINARIIPIQADLSVEADIDSLIESVLKICAFPHKIIFIAAPDLVLTRFKDLAWADFEVQLKVQLCSAFKILNRFLPEMASAKYGKVVFVLSSYTLGTPPPAMAHYVTAKYALLGLMKSLASEYAGKKIGINAVSPSMIETDFLAQIPGKIVEFTAQQHPLKRNGMPADVAPVVKFLLSDEAEFVTGVNIPVTGGV
ncbi:MAG: SDR family oxidoreductase [Nitrosomonas sp.]|nr:SDR family oxidoreductase [Nitrosomonas sp.]MDP1951383.1 SDR family oxidoreductase [Nitrosomonas sp.]